MDIGDQIRARRGTLGLTLQDLADRSGVSKAMLCDVEANKKNPTLRTVYQISLGLGCTISDLVEDAPSPAMQVVRRDAQRVLMDPETGMERRHIAPALVSRHIEVIVYTAPGGASTCWPAHPRGVVEHITVFEGSLEVLVGEERTRLETGDSITFRADVEHGYRNPKETEMRFLLVLDSTQAGSPAMLSPLEDHA